MLERLEIRQLALIQSLDIDFSAGLNLITGETGSGKSILLDALGFVLGARASSELIRRDEEACRVSAAFATEKGWDKEWQPWFDEKGLTFTAGHLILKRELSRSGRSRAWVNDESVSMGVLAELGQALADLHGQHEHQSLLRPAQHLEILDRFGGLDDALTATASAYAAWSQRRLALNSGGLSPAERRQRLDLLAGQVQELLDARLKSGEWDVLKQQARLHSSAGKRAELLARLDAGLLDGEGAAMSRLEAAVGDLRKLASLDGALQGTAGELDQAVAGLGVLAQELRSYRDSVEVDPARIEAEQARLHELERLSKKYSVDEAGLISVCASKQGELQTLRFAEEDQDGLAKALAADATAYAAAALALSKARQLAAAKLSKAATREVQELLGAKAQVGVGLKRRADPAGPFDIDGQACLGSARGIDSAELLFAPNVGEGLLPLARIASGGELSRLALALKTVFTLASGPATLVFDEIDAGVSGKAAQTVAEKLSTLASQRQVLCVTHLPQIASQPARHYRVSKHVEQGLTFTRAELLDQAGREMEVATLIDGSKLSDSARLHARELLNR